MNAPLNDGPALARAAADALRRGDARAARDLFLQAAQAGQADVAVMLGLAYACRSLQDWAGMSASADRVLALDPRNVRALMMKGDGFEQAGNTRAASAFYRAALRSAPPPDRVSPDLLQELRRVQQASEQHDKRYKAVLEKLQAGAIFKRDSEVKWHCRNCGHVHIGKEAPEKCPCCLHPRAYFEVMAENY